MVNYRRALVPGATYFFTVTLRERRKDWLIAYMTSDGNGRSRLMRSSSCQTICTQCGRCRPAMPTFTRALTRDGVPLVCDRRGQYDLWQRRYWEHLIRNDDDLARHVDYIHHNPVKHGLVADPFDWRWSRSMHSRDEGSSTEVGGVAIRMGPSATDQRSRIALRSIRATLATLAVLRQCRRSAKNMSH